MEVLHLFYLFALCSNHSTLCASYQSPTQTGSFLETFLTHTKKETHTHPHIVLYAHLYSMSYTLGLRKIAFHQCDGKWADFPPEHGNTRSCTHTHSHRNHVTGGAKLSRPAGEEEPLSSIFCIGCLMVGLSCRWQPLYVWAVSVLRLG